MMGSGKTTVGKIMARALGYSFFDWYVSCSSLRLNRAKQCFCKCGSDTLIEEAMNGTSVTEIFEHFGESVFREKEVLLLHFFFFFLPITSMA